MYIADLVHSTGEVLQGVLQLQHLHILQLRQVLHIAPVLCWFSLPLHIKWQVKNLNRGSVNTSRIPKER